MWTFPSEFVVSDIHVSKRRGGRSFSCDCHRSELSVINMNPVYVLFVSYIKFLSKGISIGFSEKYRNVFDHVFV